MYCLITYSSIPPPTHKKRSLIAVHLQGQGFHLVKVRCTINKPSLCVALLHAAISLLLWYTDAVHVKTEPILAAQEQLVIVRSMIRARSAGDSAKAVQTELPRKGKPSPMVEVLGDNLFREPFHVADDKGSSVGKKGYDAGVLIVVNVLQHLMELLKKIGHCEMR
jgi:hypothetical protein